MCVRRTRAPVCQYRLLHRPAVLRFLVDGFSLGHRQKKKKKVYEIKDNFLFLAHGGTMEGYSRPPGGCHLRAVIKINGRNDEGRVQQRFPRELLLDPVSSYAIVPQLMT